MKKNSSSFAFSVALFLLSLLGVQSAHAKYDAFNCRTSSVLESAHLQCLSCGVQNFLKKKDPNSKDYVVPSEKWMTMLGLMTRQNYTLDPKSDRFSDSNIETNLEARKVYQSRIAAMIQAYGFCTRFSDAPSSKKKDPTRISEISMRDYNGSLKKFITRNSRMNEEDSKKIAESFGFRNPWFASQADKNMQSLITGHSQGYDSKRGTPPDDFVDQSVAERRQSFIRRLEYTLNPQSSSSEGSTSSASAIIASDDEDHGLRDCLEEISQNLNGTGPHLALNSLAKEDPNSTALCGAMTTACELPAAVCSGGSNNRNSSAPSQNTNQSDKDSRSFEGTR